MKESKLKQHCREYNTLEPEKGRRGPKPKLVPHRELLQAILTKNPNVTLREIREQLPIKVCLQTIADELLYLRLMSKQRSTH